MMNKDLTVDEVAQMLNVDEDDVRAYIKAGELEAWNKTRNASTVKPHYRISPAAVERFKAARMVTPKTKPQARHRSQMRVPDHV
jgi:excisionase family DNA binding protein